MSETLKPAEPTDEAPIVKAGDGAVTVSIKSGTLIAIMGGLLGTGGGAGVFQMLQKPNPELSAQVIALEARATKLEAREAERDREIKDRLDAIEEVANETFKIVDQAHPPRGRVGVPDDR